MTQYYVDIAVGNDANAGTSPGAGNAWQTLNKAATTLVAGDIANIKASGTYTLTAAQAFTNSGDGTSGGIYYRGYTTTPGANDGRPLITTATNSINLLNLSAKQFLSFKHLQFSNTAGTRGDCVACPTSASIALVFDDCIFDGFKDAINGDWIANFTHGSLSVTNCLIKNSTRHGIYNDAGGYIRNTVIRNCVNDGIKANASSTSTPGAYIVINSIIAKNDRAVHISAATGGNKGLLLINSIIYGNTTQGIYCDGAINIWYLGLENNIIYGNGGYGINNSTPETIFYVGNHHNAFGLNTLGARNNVDVGDGDITLTADPFIDASNNDYNLNDIAGGGTLLRAANYDLAM